MVKILNFCLVSPQSLPITQMYRQKYYPGSAPDDFVLVPYDIRTDSPKGIRNQMFSPTER